MSNTLDLTRDLTAVVITHNRSEDLIQTLENLHHLPEQFQFLVVDNASSDGTETLVKGDFPRAHYLKLKENVYAEARTIGARMARTPFLAFTDDDCRWESGSLAEAVSTLWQYPRVAAVAPPVSVRGRKPDPLNRYFETSPLPRFVSMPGNSLMGFLEGSVVMRRETFLESGGYEARQKIHGEGRRVAIRLVEGWWGITYLPGILAYHYPSRVRNTSHQQRNAIRNNILTAARLEPWENVWLEIQLALKRSRRMPGPILGLLDALRGMPAAVQSRRPIQERMQVFFRLLREQKQKLERD